MFHSQGKWRLAKHLHLLNLQILEVAFGQVERLIVMMPPRHGKSEFLSKYTTAWFRGTFPDRNVILTSYEAEFAASWGAKARDVMKDVGARVWGHVVDKDAASHWTLKRARDGAKYDGSMQTAGMGGAITGKGAHLFVIDDPVKNETEAMSETIRKHHWDWFESTAITRLEPGARMIVFMTRWHDDDLVGKILRHRVTEMNERWHVIRLPATCEEPESEVEQWMGRKAGDALWPSRWPLSELAKKKTSAFWWSAMYQQRPAPLEGGLFKRQWFRYYTKETALVVDARSGEEREETFYKLVSQVVRKVGRTQCRRFSTIDLATSTKQTADFTVVGTFDSTDLSELLVLDIMRVRFEGPDQPKLIQEAYHRWKPGYLAIEKVGYQLSLMQQLLRLGLPLRPALGQDKDKVARAMPASARYEMGMVYHPAEASWLVDFEDELLHFPNAAHDDQVDVVAYAVLEVIGTGAPRIRSL